MGGVGGVVVGGGGGGGRQSESDGITVRLYNLHSFLLNETAKTDPGMDETRGNCKKRDPSNFLWIFPR